jgi:cycloeucalenol cycloisomerase
MTMNTAPALSRTRWFSANPDKAWAEKFFLTYVPIFFLYNGVVQGMGWLDTNNFWHITQNLCMWIPYCVLLPAWLRRDSGIPWQESYWFKFNLYMFVFVFLVTYFHTEYFFELLGLRYRFDDVTLYFDAALVGPDEATAAETWQKVPPGMYLNAVAFFMVYHPLAIICMRRVRSMTLGLGATGRRISWIGIVAVTALLFAWAETRLYITQAASGNVWYVDLDAMLLWGSVFYSMYFLVSFPNVYRMDEEISDPRWSVSRTILEAFAAGAISLLLLDLWGNFVGPIY